jgi:ribosomal protein L37AE/L43A
MDDLLMLHGETRQCGDCGTETVFLPVEAGAWVCTACDAAVLLTPWDAAA